MDEPEGEFVIATIKHENKYIFTDPTSFFAFPTLLHFYKECRDARRPGGCCISDGCGEWGNSVH